MENRPLFDPYGINTGVPYTGKFGNYGAFGSNVPFSFGLPANYDYFSTPAEIKNFFDSQYLYYRYLNEVLDYKMKVKEFEKLNPVKKEDKA